MFYRVKNVVIFLKFIAITRLALFCSFLSMPCRFLHDRDANGLSTESPKSLLIPTFRENF